MAVAPRLVKIILGFTFQKHAFAQHGSIWERIGSVNGTKDCLYDTFEVEVINEVLDNDGTSEITTAEEYVFMAPGMGLQATTRLRVSPSGAPLTWHDGEEWRTAPWATARILESPVRVT